MSKAKPAKTKHAAKPKAKAAKSLRAPMPTIRGALETVMVSYEQLAASSFNPRRTFDDTALAELAASIAEHGLLENLILRPAVGKADPKRGLRPYDIVAGERRYRAIGLLVKAKKWDPAAAIIPAQIRQGTEAELRALALIENLQRQDVPPMEEAEGFAALRALDPTTWSTGAIATRIGKTQRYVQQRIALVERLDPAVQTALRQGDIDVTHARALVVAPAKEQREALKKIEAGYGGYIDAERLTDTMLSKLPLIASAYFPIEQYTGEIAEGPKPYGTEDGRRALDKKQFDQLQKAALDAKRDALAKKWAWVKIERGYSFPDSNYKKSSDPKKAGAVIFIESRYGAPTRVIIKTGLIERERNGSPAQQQRDWKEEQREREARKAERRAAATKFNDALRAAIAADPKSALPILIAELLYPRSRHDLGADLLEWRSRETASPLCLPWRDHFGALARRRSDWQDIPGLALIAAPAAPDLLARLCALRDPGALLAILVAERAGIRNDTTAASPLLMELAKRFGIEVPKILERGLYDPDDDDPFGDAGDSAQACRVCGCTEDDACHNDDTDETCHWVEPDLCSACAPGQVAKPSRKRGKGPQDLTAAPGDMVGLGAISEAAE